MYIILLLTFSLTVFAESTVRLYKKGIGPDSLPSRDIYVYLPDGYEKSHLSYPVLYMHDGQNLFDPTRAFLGQTWKTKETLDTLISKKIIRPLIVVAIDNTPSRMSEYAPEKDGIKYLDFISFKLKSMIDRDFRTIKNRDLTGIMGSSLGGLISLQAGMSHFHTFGLIGALSPSIWYNDKSIVTAYQMTQFLPLNVYLDSGTEGGENADDVWELARTLEQRRISPKVIIQQGAGHSERFWAQRFPEALIFLYSERAFAF
ncbi:MAG: alpha/beta hydrolase [Bacteriovoracaceae bacterium]